MTVCRCTHTAASSAATACNRRNAATSAIRVAQTLRMRGKSVPPPLAARNQDCSNRGQSRETILCLMGSHFAPTPALLHERVSGHSRESDPTLMTPSQSESSESEPFS